MAGESNHIGALPDFRSGWNEIQFLDADQLERMAPSILGLEISRLDGVCRAVAPGSDQYTAAVKARYEIRRFLDSLPDAADGVRHLEAALVCLAWTPGSRRGEVTATLRYTADRIAHVVERIRLLY